MLYPGVHSCAKLISLILVKVAKLITEDFSILQKCAKYRAFASCKYIGFGFTTLKKSRIQNVKLMIVIWHIF